MIMGHIQWSGACGCCWNYCGRTVATTLWTQRNLVDMWFHGLSHVARCSGQPLGRRERERERPNKLCVFPYSRRPLCVSSSLCPGFYSTGMYLCMIVVVIIVVENGGICLFVYSRERPNKLCIFPTSNPCAFPAAWAQDLILRESLHACGTSVAYHETPSMIFWFDWWW